MVLAEIVGDQLVITMTGWDILWSCKRLIEIPLSHITSVRAETKPSFPKPGYVLRMGGTALPGVIIAGNYVSNGKWYFWNVHYKGDAVVIDLQGQHYSQIVIEVPNPHAFVKQLNSQISPRAVAV